jgi:transcriptional regulator with XRE-family HTH domain
VPESEADLEVSDRRAVVGRRMRDLRKRAGMSQAAVAQAAGLSRPFYLRVEAGRRTLSLDNLFAIANALTVDVREFFTE